MQHFCCVVTLLVILVTQHVFLSVLNWLMTSRTKFKCWLWTNKTVEWTVNAPWHVVMSQDAFIVVSAQYWFPQIRGHAIAEAVVCFLLWRPGLIPRIVQGQFAMDKVAVRQAFLQLLWYYCAICEATSVTVIIRGMIGWFEAIVPRYFLSPLSQNHDKRVAVVIQYGHFSYVYYV